jgi:hypothetical protein
MNLSSSHHCDQYLVIFIINVIYDGLSGWKITHDSSTWKDWLLLIASQVISMTNGGNDYNHVVMIISTRHFTCHIQLHH